MTTQPELTPESLTARIIAELQEYPEARILLLRALLTDEFLGVPARLTRVEESVVRIEENVAELQGDVKQLQGTVEQLQGTVGQLQGSVKQLQSDVEQLKADGVDTKARLTRLESDVSDLKGTNLEITGARRIPAILFQRMGLRRPAIVHSLNAPMSGNTLENLYYAEEQGAIDAGADLEVLQTDVILRAQRQTDRETVWVAVEISNTIDQHDITRARERADILAAAYSETALAAVAGNGIRQEEQEMADSLGVMVVVL